MAWVMHVAWGEGAGLRCSGDCCAWRRMAAEDGGEEYILGFGIMDKNMDIGLSLIHI